MLGPRHRQPDIGLVGKLDEPALGMRGSLAHAQGRHEEDPAMPDEKLQATAEQMQLTAELALILFEHSPDAILIVNEAGTIVLANRQAELLFGYPRIDLRASNVDILLPEGLRPDHHRHRAGFMEDPRVRPMGIGLDLKIRRKNGTEASVYINLSPVALRQGMYVIATVRRRPPPQVVPAPPAAER
jgi:PAS domain S-box-containing protein